MLSIFNRAAPVKAKLVRWNQTPCLIASFYTSTPPLVWQLDLEKASSFVLTLNEKDGEWDLGYTPSQGDFVSIARFDDREDAECAYNIIQRTIAKGMSSTPSMPLLKKIFYVLLIVVLGLILVQSLSPSKTGKSGPDKIIEEHFSNDGWPDPTEMTGQAPQQQETERQELKTGVPMTADDVLPKDVQ